jgi:hypothetical protein
MSVSSRVYVTDAADTSPASKLSTRKTVEFPFSPNPHLMFPVTAVSVTDTRSTPLTEPTMDDPLTTIFEAWPVDGMFPFAAFIAVNDPATHLNMRCVFVASFLGI